MIAPLKEKQEVEKHYRDHMEISPLGYLIGISNLVSPNPNS